MKNELKQIKEQIKYKLNKEGVVGDMYRKFSTLKYQLLVEKRDVTKMTAAYKKKMLNTALKMINETTEDNIVLYNPTWLGVANSTKGLFTSIVPLEAVKKADREKLIIAINKNKNIKSVIFSQIVDGWTDLIKELKKSNKDLKLKVIWHANNFEVISDYTWDLNKKVIDLYDEGYITSIAFVKESMAKFYEKKGYNTYNFLNNVRIDEKIKSQPKETPKNFMKEEIKIGVYNAHSRELKNIYTQLLVGTYFENAIVDIVPSSKEVIDYAKKLGIKFTDINRFIPTEELLKRILENDINVYATFTECSPMFPLESFEMGVPCLIGNNNDYFMGSKLREYVTVNREDDPEEIYNKIVNVLNNKDEVMKLYREWKEQFDKDLVDKVNAFLNS